jgi:uncharacterized protein (DUF4213/DUF364 family)
VELFEDLLDSVRDLDCPVKRVCIGPRRILVESRHVGVSCILKNPNQQDSLDASEELLSSSAFQLAERLNRDELLQASLGLAALNSLIDIRGDRANVIDEITDFAKGKTVTIVGRFAINNRIVAAARKTYVLEIEPEEGELPAEACEEVIPVSDVVVITATALINKTMSRLLDLSSHAKTYVIGPSTPMNDVLLQHGADVLGGMQVTDVDALERSIVAGAGRFKDLAGVKAIVRR